MASHLTIQSEQRCCAAELVPTKSFFSCIICPFLLDITTFFSGGSFLRPGNVNSLQMGLSRWQGQHNTVGVGGPASFQWKRLEFQLGTCPLLRTWIMLSVHGHYRSWNDKANELRAGRWVQDLLSLNQLTSGPLLSERLEEKVHWLGTAWDLNPSLCIRRHVHRTGHCIVTGKNVHPVLSFGNVLTNTDRKIWQVQLI